MYAVIFIVLLHMSIFYEVFRYEFSNTIFYDIKFYPRTIVDKFWLGT